MFSVALLALSHVCMDRTILFTNVAEYFNLATVSPQFENIWNPARRLVIG